MKYINQILILILSVFSWGCSSKKEQYRGSFNDLKYTLYDVTKKDIIAKHYYQQLKIEGLPTLDINYKTTNMGIPYSFELFSAVPHVVLDSSTYAYSNVFEQKSTHFATLYVDPDRFSTKQFETLKEFFTKEWTRIKDSVTLKQGFRELQFVALVYGTDKQFSRYFKHGDETIEVWTNGDVHLSFANRSLQSTNLSPKVQMPGFRLILRQPYQPFTFEDLYKYKDHDGKTLMDYFTIIKE